MSLSTTLSSALSGLTVASRAVEVTSSNIANALTEGYGRRELQISARVSGGAGQGAVALGVSRAVDPALLTDRRMAEAGAAESERRLAALNRIEAAVGLPGGDGALSSRVSDLEGALIAAASRPDAEARLATALASAQALATGIAAAATEVQAVRQAADSQIARDVANLNTTLRRVADLNSDIRTRQASGRDVSALLDQRQQLVDQIAELVPLREVAREGGQIALYSAGGAVLLDGRASEFGFAATSAIGPATALGRLALNGQPVSARQMAGGGMAASFALRDDLAPAAQARLDGLARDLVERFQTAPGEAGLFTDAGQAFSGAEAGLALRLAVNPAADPAQGGALWRLRDGLGATEPAVAPQGAGLTRMHLALTGNRSPASAVFMAGGRSLAGLVSDVQSGIGAARLAANSEASFAAAKAEALRSTERQGGVDTDQEMQQLLLIEQAYAANARVIQIVDDLVKTLLGM
jgi:flagellar hook-associated protein 1 FlgK